MRQRHCIEWAFEGEQKAVCAGDCMEGKYARRRGTSLTTARMFVRRVGVYGRQAGWYRRRPILSQQSEVCGTGSFFYSKWGTHERKMHCRVCRGGNAGGFLEWRTDMSKVVIIGAGHVGSHVARSVAAENLCDEIVLVDKLPEKAVAQAMDVADSLSLMPAAARVRAGGYDECADADITVVAIGKPREPGQTRLDLLGDSVRMIRDLGRDLRAVGVGGLVVSITNPCDIIADCLRRELGMDRTRAFGTGTLLDTARLLRVLNEQTWVPREAIEAYVLGEHGDSSMIPYSALSIAGRRAMDTPGFDAEEALSRTHSIGMDIIEGKGSTEFGIGQAAAYLIRVILTDAKAVLPLSVHLEGEYGIFGIHCGVPCVVGRNGIERIVELRLTDTEKEDLARSAAVLRKYTEMADQITEGL